MTLACTPYDSDNQALLTRPESNSQAGLAPLLLTVVELVRQLLEAQIIRRMEKGVLSESDLDRAAESIQKLQEQILYLCEIFEVEPEELNVHLGEFGTLLPEAGSYYPGEEGIKPSVLELVDRNSSKASFGFNFSAGLIWENTDDSGSLFIWNISRTSS